MDLVMPGMSGLEATRRILSSNPNAAILVLTMADDDSVFAAIRRELAPTCRRTPASTSWSLPSSRSVVVRPSSARAREIGS